VIPWKIFGSSWIVVREKRVVGTVKYFTVRQLRKACEIVAMTIKFFIKW